MDPMMLKRIAEALERVADELRVLNEEGIIVFGGQTQEEN